MAEKEPTPTDPTHPYPTALARHPTLRQSLLASFQMCALETKFDLEYRQGWDSHLSAEGTLFHRFAAKALDHMADSENRTIDPEDGLAILAEVLRQHDVGNREVTTIPLHLVKRLRWVVVKWCHENVFDSAKLLDTELRLEAEIGYGDFQEHRRRITGQLDCVFVPEEDWAVVPDWKNSWAVPRPSELSEGGYFQQRTYALLIFRNFPAIKRVTLRETYVRLKDEVTQAAPVREATVFRNELVEIEEEIAMLAERFDRTVEHGVWPLVERKDEETDEERRERESNLWKPSPGAHCSYCPRPTACPIFPTARREGRISSEEEAERIAAQAVVAEAALKQSKAALQAWAAAKGPIPIRHAKDPHRVLGYRERKRTSRPKKEDVEQAMREQGPNLDLDSLYTTTTQTRFEQHSHTPIEDNAADAELLNALEASIDGQKKPQGAGDASPGAA